MRIWHGSNLLNHRRTVDKVFIYSEAKRALGACFDTNRPQSVFHSIPTSIAFCDTPGLLIESWCMIGASDHAHLAPIANVPVDNDKPKAIFMYSPPRTQPYANGIRTMVAGYGHVECKYVLLPRPFTVLPPIAPCVFANGTEGNFIAKVVIILACHLASLTPCAAALVEGKTELSIMSNIKAHVSSPPFSPNRLTAAILQGRNYEDCPLPKLWAHQK